MATEQRDGISRGRIITARALSQLLAALALAYSTVTLLAFLFDGAQHTLETLPRLVLLDLNLPKMDGIQVLREVKNNPLTRCIPVVVLTSSREERDLVDSYWLGVNSYLQKPVDFDQFRAMVKQIGFYWMVVNQIAPNGRGTEVRTA